MRRPYHHGDLRNALVRAGAELLARNGVAGLTLRKAARRAGVSHSAPYNHFPDKQALVAAISTHGLEVVRERIAAVRRREKDALRQLLEVAWETVRFGLEEPDLYQVTFGNAVGREKDYPAYVETAHRGFDELVDLVQACQARGVVAPGPADVAATGLWALVHGLVSLLRNHQVPRRLLERAPPRELLLQVLGAQLRAPGGRGWGASTGASTGAAGAARMVTRESPMARKPATIDEYLATIAGPTRAALIRLRRAIHAAVPEAQECISYGMPAFRVEGGVVAGFAARAEGGSYYPFSGSTLAAMADELEGYRGTKSALHFAADQPLPAALVRKLVQTRLAEMARRSGRAAPAVSAPSGRARARRKR